MMQQLSTTSTTDVKQEEEDELHRPLSILTHLSSSSSLSSLARASTLVHSSSLSSLSSLSSVVSASLPASPFTLLALPDVWLAHIFSFLSPSEKLTDISHVNKQIHGILTQLSAAFRDDHLELHPSLLPSLSLNSPPWFRGLSSVTAKATAPAWFELDAAAVPTQQEELQAEEQLQDQATTTQDQDSSGRIASLSESSPERTPVMSAQNSSIRGVTSSPTSPSSNAASPAFSYSATVSPSPMIWQANASPSKHGVSSPSSTSAFSSIRSLSISLTRSNPMINIEQANMFSGFPKWSNLRFLEIKADDDDHEHYDCSLTTAAADAALLRHQQFSAFTQLVHLHTLIIDATIRSDQVLALIGMPALQCLQLTEREQHIWHNEETWIREEERMVESLGKVSRLVRSGHGLIKLQMPRFHHATSVDGFCLVLVDDDEQMFPFPCPLSSLSIQGVITRRGVSALSSLPSLQSLTMGWGCDMDKQAETLASLSSLLSLKSLRIRLIDPNEAEEHDEDTYFPVLPALQHVLSVPTLFFLSVHLPPHGWTAAHTQKLSQLAALRKLCLTGEPSGINARLPMNYDILKAMISRNSSMQTLARRDDTLPFAHLHSLQLDWLPITDDAILVISCLSSLLTLSLVNCPYLTSVLFFLLSSLPKLAKLKVYRCDVNMTAEGWITAEADAQQLYAQHPHPLLTAPASFDTLRFPALQVLECHLVHRLVCDVDTQGFSRFLSLLPKQHLHSFDFDSDYSTAAHFLLLSSFSHLRSLGTPNVDVCPYDDEATRRAKGSFARVEKVYYSRAYTRIHRGQRNKWSKDRRSSINTINKLTTSINHSDQSLLNADDDDVDLMCLLADDLDLDDCMEVATINPADREACWIPHYNSVEFRHTAAREAFFQELQKISQEEEEEEEENKRRQQQEQQQQQQQRARAAQKKMDTEEEQYQDDEGEQQEQDDSYDGEDADDYEDYDVDDEKYNLLEDGDDDADDPYSYGSVSSSRRPLSVSLVGRSLKLHSRRWKRDEKAAIKSKSAHTHAEDGSVAGRKARTGNSVSFKWNTLLGP